VAAVTVKVTALPSVTEAALEANEPVKFAPTPTNSRDIEAFNGVSHLPHPPPTGCFGLAH
jgi:hypothetical protein